MAWIFPTLAPFDIEYVKPNPSEIFARQQYKQTWQKDLYSLFPTDHGFQKNFPIKESLNKSNNLKTSLRNIIWNKTFFLVTIAGMKNTCLGVFLINFALFCCFKHFCKIFCKSWPVDNCQIISSCSLE